MKTNFVWNKEKIELYKRASQYTGFYENIGDMIKPFLDKSLVAADIGCGAGLLSFAVSPMLSKVYAIDINKDAINHLKNEILATSSDELSQPEHGNIIPINADAETLDNISWDIGLMCFYGYPDKELSKLIRRSKERTFIIVNNGTPQTKDQNSTLEKVYAPKIDLFLREEGFEFVRENHQLEFGQPFKSKDEVKLYTDIYANHLNDNERQARYEDRVKALEKTDSKEYPLYLPHLKEISLFRIEG